MGLLSIYLIFRQFQPGIAYKKKHVLPISVHVENFFPKEKKVTFS